MPESFVKPPFEEVYTRYFGLLCSQVARMVGWADAEDLVQEAYVRAYARYQAAEFPAERALRVWLLRIAENHARDLLRARTCRTYWLPWSTCTSNWTRRGSTKPAVLRRPQH